MQYTDVEDMQTYTLLEGALPYIMCLQVSFFIRIESGKCFGMPSLDVSAGRLCASKTLIEDL